VGNILDALCSGFKQPGYRSRREKVHERGTRESFGRGKQQNPGGQAHYLTNEIVQRGRRETGVFRNEEKSKELNPAFRGRMHPKRTCVLNVEKDQELRWKNQIKGRWKACEENRGDNSFFTNRGKNLSFFQGKRKNRNEKRNRGSVRKRRFGNEKKVVTASGRDISR